ncbi:MAG: 4-alpha-glucanotransferase [bacterium]|nr:4-alpha-glucanotransferase [bacterium]
MKLKRSSGLLMHITSLPGEHGIGTMGKEAYEFVDLMVQGGQKYWQILPTGPVSSTFSYSPYSSTSSFAGNYLFINIPMLQKESWMRHDIISKLPAEENNDFVDFDNVVAYKLPLLKNASANFFKYADEDVKEEFRKFCKSSKHWLDDYTLFIALANHYGSCYWLEWKDKKVRMRSADAIKKWTKTLEEQISFQKFIQFIFFKQWTALKKYANSHGVEIIGDIPIYVNLDSADSWACPEIFHLDPKTLRPLEVAGVPPDYFSKTGQLWGNPLYQWFENKKLKKETLGWWERRFKHSLQLFDIIRIDHFRGFESYWAVPAKAKTAIDGKWKKGPGVELFNYIKDKLGSKSNEPLPLIAEDLGVITPKVEKLRDGLGLPGMKILQFAFDSGHKNEYLPHNYTNPNCIVFTGTHDNNTTNGWFYENEIDEKTRKYVLKYLRVKHRDEFHWQLINLALSSIAALSIFPVQDILGYAGQFRMNVPGKVGNNWTWKLTSGRLTSDLMHELKEHCQLYGRLVEKSKSKERKKN